jgi:hypothetical protein
MDTSAPLDPTAGPAPALSPPRRAIAIFTRPASAWVGLTEHAQWRFPMLAITLFSAATGALLHQRAILPMMLDTWDRQVASGQMSGEQADKMEQFFSGPAGTAISAGQQAIVVPIMTLVIGLLVWFGVGFVLGTRFRYRLALEVAAWSSLISIPGAVLTVILAWTRQTMQGVHIGFGVLLPETDTPSKLQSALGVILDALGPFSIWYVAVGILGAAALSGAPRKSVAWTLGALYVVMVLIAAALAALFAPGA